MATNKMICTKCGKEKAINRHFYLSHSHLYDFNNNRIPVCKDCIMERYEDLRQKYGDDVKAVYHICINFDVYFNSDLVESAYSQMAKDGNDNLAKVYFSKVNSLMQYKGMTSFDSDTLILDNTRIEEDGTITLVKEPVDDIEEELDFQVTMTMRRKWGLKLEKEDYFFLENKYKEFTESYECRTPAQKLIFEQICKSLLEGEKARERENIAGFEKMNNVVSKLMSDGNIKPIQESAVAEDDTASWGKWINLIEQHRPIGEASEQFKDVDKISAYMTKWFTKQMQKVFDLFGGDDDANES